MFQSRIITKPLSHLHVHTRGSDQNPTLLLLHGFLGSSLDFNVLATLLEQKYHLLLVDLPGHGRSHIQSPPTFEELALCLKQIITNLGKEKADLLGYSMGGRIALYTSCTFPKIFPQCTALSATPGLASKTEQKQRLKKDLKLCQHMNDFPRFVKEWYEQPLFNSLRKTSAFPSLLNIRLQEDPSQLQIALRGLSVANQPSLWEELKNIPSLHYIYGEEDLAYATLATKIKAACPQARFTGIPNTGHALHIEAPEAVANLFDF